jgi:ATP synthase protein I
MEKGDVEKQERLERLGELEERIAKKEERKLKARKEKHRGLWFGLGMFGMVGWSVAIPTLLGVALGAAIDRAWPSRFSWTLTFLFVGAAVGCWNTWYWVSRKRRGDDS